MSYNILADRLALPNYFPHTTRSRLSFEFRGPRVIAEIRQSRADVICLQEVDRVSDYYEMMFNALGYKLLHYGRPGLLWGEGVAIAYNIDKVRLLEKEEIDFDALSNFYPSGGVFRKANQAILCLF
jgi:mRNA deadenylase 3'-5' endonuclease subunit Ccr4